MILVSMDRETFGLHDIMAKNSYANESFTFCYEDYSESFWVTADSVGAAMLLSDLAKEFSSLEIRWQ